jgi:hypothetical protein
MGFNFEEQICKNSPHCWESHLWTTNFPTQNSSNPCPHMYKAKLLTHNTQKFPMLLGMTSMQHILSDRKWLHSWHASITFFHYCAHHASSCAWFLNSQRHTTIIMLVIYSNFRTSISTIAPPTTKELCPAKERKWLVINTKLSTKHHV